MRFGTVAVVGRTNVGKSTFLNAVLGQPLAIVSPLPQTTRDTLLGVLHAEDAQIAFIDTPGLHRPRSELGRRMNSAAIETIKHTDAIVFMTALGARSSSAVAGPSIEDDDLRLIQLIPKGVPCILAINKIDLLRDKRKLLPLLVAFQELHDFVSIIPTSILKADGIDRVLKAVIAHLPEQAPRYDEDTMTDRPVSFFAREYVREQVLKHTRSEVPHAVAVTLDRFEERPNLTRILATIHVEKAGQKAIVVGHQGNAIKQIGTDARARLESLLGTRVYLELFVRVTERWKDMPRQLAELGYESEGGGALSHLLPAKPKPSGNARKKSRSKPKATKSAAPRAKSSRSSGRATKRSRPGAKPAVKHPKEKRR